MAIANMRLTSVTSAGAGSITASGVIYIHSATAALRPHIEWAIGRVLGHRVQLNWTAQSVQPGTYRCEFDWRGNEETADQLASALLGCKPLRFEVTRDATGGLGERYAFTPRLGLFRAPIDGAGNIQVGENQLRKAMSKAGGREDALADSLDELLGTPWDDELEVFRYAGEDAPVQWLSRAV